MKKFLNILKYILESFMASISFVVIAFIFLFGSSESTLNVHDDSLKYKSNISSYSNIYSMLGENYDFEGDFVSINSSQLSRFSNYTNTRIYTDLTIDSITSSINFSIFTSNDNLVLEVILRPRINYISIRLCKPSDFVYSTYRLPTINLLSSEYFSESLLEEDSLNVWSNCSLKLNDTILFDKDYFNTSLDVYNYLLPSFDFKPNFYIYCYYSDSSFLYDPLFSYETFDFEGDDGNDVFYLNNFDNNLSSRIWFLDTDSNSNFSFNFNSFISYINTKLNTNDILYYSNQFMINKSFSYLDSLSIDSFISPGISLSSFIFDSYISNMNYLIFGVSDNAFKSVNKSLDLFLDNGSITSFGIFLILLSSVGLVILLLKWFLSFIFKEVNSW